MMWRCVRARFVVTTVLLTALTLAGATVGGVSGGPAVSRAEEGEDPALLRELAERLLSPPPPPGAREAPRARLFPGALPPALELDLPVPPGSRLIGSVRHGVPGPQKVESVEVVLDAPGSPAEVAAFYQGALGERGWSTPARGEPPTGGFQPTAGPKYRQFCAGPAGPFLNLNVFPVPGGLNDVRLNIVVGAPGPCGEPPPRAQIPFELLPALTAPEGVDLTGVATGPSRPGALTSDAVAETDLSPAALEAHFAAQLAAAGWTRVDGAARGRLAWSVWQVPGEGEWEGLLYVLEGPGSGRRSLHLQVATPRPEAVPFK